ncbi:plasmid transfer protein [Pontibacter mangrovi]|uniref:Plasmid transfer protein n=1 Tax=Pontibacter mangrovi TaxID=2589816 RepID=A0A501W242_9BACT|nr:plasmid transfer protein [Pontibacter mangrovi]TPE39716.1 plasmid transfer protein [Pontibacter mangrovi]
MRELIDQAVFELFDELFGHIQELVGVFLYDAQALCAVCMLLYFGLEAYKMMAGDARLRVIPLLRPFALTLVVVFWPAFIDTVNMPLQVVNHQAKGLYASQVDQVEDLHRERLALVDSVARQLTESSAEFERIEAEASDASWYETMGIDLQPLFDKMKGYYLMLLAKLHFAAMMVVEWCVLTVFQCCAYIVYFLQIVFAGILVILGPFSFALSVLPGFKDAYLTWIARYISVGLYSGLGYLVMSISFVLVKFGLMKEIDVLRAVLSDPELFMAYVSFPSGGISFYLVSLLVGGLSMLTVPVISTWIVRTTGVSAAVGTVAGGAARAAGGMLK